MVHPSPDPASRLRDQALRVRRLWRATEPRARVDLVSGLRDDELGSAWASVLTGEHPFCAWLDGDEPWPPQHTWPGPAPRALVTSHPFARRKPWSTPATSVTSSSTQRGS